MLFLNCILGSKGTQFRVKNQFTHRPQTPHIHSFFSHAVSVPHLKVRGSLSHLSPRALLLVITRATITRRWHSETGRRACGSRSVCRPCAGTVEQVLQRLSYFGRVFLETQALDMQQDFRDHHYCQLAFISDHLKAKKRRLLCDDFFYSIW